MLCVGLDTDINRVPDFIKEHYDNPVLEFNRRIIEATKGHCVAYKFNIAFYEALGAEGWKALGDSLALIPDDIFTIADAKRGDIGNTSSLYARTFFETYDFDSITVSPYMGSDSLEPFYGYSDKWVIILGLTSNKGSRDVQMQPLADGRKVYEETIRRSAQYGDAGNTMFVVGATKTEYIQRIREIVPDHFFLMPGIGKQGGDLDAALQYGLNKDYGLLINSSRGIIYAEEGEGFEIAATKVCQKMNQDMRVGLRKFH
ncbi:UNVERIFIED_CONTAM: hypothetical protein GTU68_036717 [Idotea baltica]|nr:hypothetical protein [Idotea baltica]